MIPVDREGRVGELWRGVLPGADVDGLDGAHPFDLAKIEELRVTSDRSGPSYGDQLAITLLPYRREEEFPKLEVVTLELDDPWDGIYAACLGALPESLDAEYLRTQHYNPDLAFEDFAHVDRVRVMGSLDDLLERLVARTPATPRRMSMLHLAYGTSGSSSIRSRTDVIPQEGFARNDAGPNVVVVCSPGSTDDLALLWNLRAANGDAFSVPIGVPAESLDADALSKILREGRIAINGMPHRSLYVTSTSVSAADLRSAVAQQDMAEIVEPAELVDLGRPGTISRDEVLIWAEGKSRVQMVPRDSVERIFERGAPSDFTRMYLDVQVYDSPLPQAPDYRVGDFYAGSRTTFTVLDRSSKIEDLEWPSRLLMAQSLAARRGYDLAESDPGRVARFALAAMGSIPGIDMLIHAPLLGLLEEMAARQGFNWYKSRLRSQGDTADPLDAVGPTVDELPRKTLNDFRKVLGQNSAAARQWLVWAEKANVVVKGFEISCPVCGAKQWLPVSAFAPPITCRGCAGHIEYPFGQHTSVDFRYRLSERMRRVFECDAMGHLLLLRLFRYVFHPSPGGGGFLVGMSPGMEVRKRGTADPLGEADLLMLSRAGEFIPAEFKRSATGLTEGEMEKLDRLCEALHSPWSVVAYAAYNKDVETDIAGLERRDSAGVRTRVVLSYDRLLSVHPVWSMGDDPFAIRTMSQEEIDEREAAFVSSLAGIDPGDRSWLEYSMLETR
ncbi:hypothetical protein [Oerskovia enterophila]|uniref:hypothetical protein n=1 Tax=Oerskovia enterophila TaxID=43678 RepID=UPI001B801E46|nr:hypothetical protein [Oerskovia enterophila]